MSKPGSVLDSGATILGLLNSDLDKNGYGVNLLSDQQTLREKKGSEINRFLLSQKRAIVDAMWNNPDLREGAEMKVDQKKLIFSQNQWVNLPALIGVSDKGEITKLEFKPSKEQTRKANHLRKQKDTLAQFIWIDECEEMVSAEIISNAEKPSNEMAWCVSFKGKDFDAIEWKEVGKNSSLEPEWIKETFIDF